MTGLDALPPGASVRRRADGFADYLVGPAARRRILTDRFIETFEAWGYGFMATPLIEPLDTIAAGVGGAQQSALFRFMDSDGALLALVGERTVSVARVVATQLQEGPFPLRLCYAGSVLRNQAPNGGRRRESLQARVRHFRDADARLHRAHARGFLHAGQNREQRRLAGHRQTHDGSP
ncbi:MAG: ATP phosphoribosyltransferase regulatory subunit, partial [Candidatus Dormibacteria bacterium]